MNATLAMRPPEPGKHLSVVLAVAVHLLLAAFLVYGVRWQTKVNDVVEVELVRSLPPIEPMPQPEAKPEPPPRPEPRPQPKAEAKPPPKPDIAIKTKEKPKPPPPPPKETPKFDPFKQQLAQEEKHRELQRQLAEEDRRVAERRAASAQMARDKALASYSDRIRAKIRGNIVLPPDLRGNPSAVFEVVQLPSGEVISARLTKTSGHPGYDGAVERAILKSSPLPRPDDPSLFVRSLTLTFCPQEDGKCG